MSQTSSKKSVFDRIGGNLSSTTTNVANKSTHGFCNAFVKTGSCPLGDACKYIHEQPNLEKQTGSKDDMRITKTFTRVVDMSSSSIKSTITVSNEQRPVGVSNPIQSSRMVVETPNTNSIEHSDRRLSSSDRKQSSDSKSKSSSKKKSHSSSHDTRHSSNKRTRSNDDGDSPVSSASDSEHVHSSYKHKHKSDSHSKSSKHRKHPSISPNRDEEETLNDQLMSQSQNYGRSPKRTIVITERKKDERSKRSSHSSKSKTSPDIEFLELKSTKSERKPTETIHQQAENIRKTIEIKREKKSPSRSTTSDHQRHHSSLTSTNLTVKTEHQSSKTQNSTESSDRTVSQSTPLVVQLSPAVESTEKESVTPVNDAEKSTAIQPPSPVCVILDDDSSPTPSIDKKFVRQISEKKSIEPEKSSSKSTKRSRDSDRTQNKDNVNEYSDSKRKRLNDETSKKTSSSSKNSGDKRSSSNRSDAQRSTNISSRDDSSSRKYSEKSELKTSRQSDSKDRHPAASSSSKSRSNHDRHDASKSSSDKKRSTYRREKEKGLENVTDSEEHHDEPVPPKPTALELYMSMDWSALSRDKRIPLNTQVTSRTVHSNHSINVCERFLTDEQKAQLNGVKCQTYPLTDFVKQLQNQSTPSIVQSCQRRFGSCAKDMLDMRHKWFIKSIEPVQSYEFINKEHYLAYQQAINTLLDRTSTDAPTVQIETTTADVLLS